MLEIATVFIVQLIDYIPMVFAIYILFDLIGSLLFNKRWYKWKYMYLI